MKIPLKLILVDKNERPNLHLQRLFKYLESEKELEKLVTSAKTKIKKDFSYLNKVECERVFKEVSYLYLSSLRSLRNSELILPPEVISDGFDEIIKPIIEYYPFMAEWRHGLISYLLGDYFVVPNTHQPIKLRVSNNSKNIPYLLKDSENENGVKIIITENISKGNLRSWIEKTWSKIEKEIMDLPTYTKRKTNKTVYEKGLLYFFLKRYKCFGWKKISNITKTWDDGEYQSYTTIKNMVLNFPYYSV